MMSLLTRTRAKGGGVTPGHLALFEAIKNKRFRQAQLLVEGGADVNGRNQKGETPLIASCVQVQDERTRARFCQLLLEAQADVNGRDGNGQTVLIHAAILGCQNVVDVLLNYSLTDMNAQDTQGNTALMYAAMFGHEEIVKTLLNSQNQTQPPQTNLKNFSGLTAADLARNKGHARLELALRVYDPKTKDKKTELHKLNNIPRPVLQIQQEDSYIQPPNRPPTPAHLHLLPTLDLNASQSSVRSEPDTRPTRLRLSDSALSRIRSEPNDIGKLPRQVTVETYEEVVDLTDGSNGSDSGKTSTDIRLPPILPTRALHLLTGVDREMSEERITRRKSLKRRKEERESAHHVPLIDAK